MIAPRYRFRDLLLGDFSFNDDGERITLLSASRLHKRVIGIINTILIDPRSQVRKLRLEKPNEYKMVNHKPTAMLRMKKDYLRLKCDPIPYITAEPLPSNLLNWHYVFKGPENSPYQGGYYHGTILFPRDFPFKPPSIYVLTPNGRFKTNTPICLSITDDHPETWNPTWSVGTILTGLLSFMLETTQTFGSTESTRFEKEEYAKKSLAFNLKDSNFRKLFPNICDEINARLQKQNEDSKNENASSSKNKESNSDSFLNWYSIYFHLVGTLIFAIFVLIVTYVIQNLN